MNQQEADDINVGMDLYHQLVEAKMEAERWKAKYEALEQLHTNDETTRLMAEVIDWREKYDRLDKAHDLLECRDRRSHFKENQVQSALSMYDTIINLIQIPMIEAQWEDMLAMIKLIDADKYARLAAQIKQIMAARSMNAPE